MKLPRTNSQIPGQAEGTRQVPPQSGAPPSHLPEATTNFSRHNLFTAINFVRLMQKMGFGSGGFQEGRWLGLGNRGDVY